MNKKIITTAGAIAIAGVIGFSVYQSNAEPVEPKFSKVETSEVIDSGVTEAKETRTEENTSSLSTEEARALALKEYPGIVTEFEVESNRGNIVYEIDIKNEDTEYELKIAGDTGEIIKVEKEKEYHSEIAEIISNQEEFLTMLETEEIALQEFDGAVESVKLDKDDGRYIYEIELKNGSKEAEFEIDAKTGEIIDYDVDYED